MSGRELYAARQLVARLEHAARVRGDAGPDRDRPTPPDAAQLAHADELVRRARAELALHWATVGERA